MLCWNLKCVIILVQEIQNNTKQNKTSNLRTIASSVDRYGLLLGFIIARYNTKTINQ